jgi:hypothetical protein
MNKRLFIGFEYWSGRNTTTGEPNKGPGKFHGRLSIAGDAKVFEGRALRDTWVESAPPGTIREAISKRTLRRLTSGLTAEEFNAVWQWIVEEKTIKER